MCKEGQRISSKCRGICVTKDGECTELYYHIQDCDACEQIRLLEIESQLS